MTSRNVLMMTGGPAFHPVGEQAEVIAGWLGAGYRCRALDGAAALDALGTDVDLLVVMGLYWPGMSAEWAGKLSHEPLSEAVRRKVAAFRGPVVCHHGGIASFPEAPEFAELCGWQWVWEQSSHSPFGTWNTRIIDDSHAVTRGVRSFDVDDEIYFNLRVAQPDATRVLAVADYDGAARPMVSVSESDGRRRVYLANGHDLRAFTGAAEQPMRRLWTNSIRWACGDNTPSEETQ
jgi:hypothetical protein